ncbi:precorrin-4 C(11)-methyltransferase [bacterium]|nr:MAG: precorrin-4 C(11)-methyltransferase [bacterium]
MKNIKPSTVHFVGAGPGDAELITVKGMRLLKEAGVVIYAGSLVQKAMLKYCKAGVKLFDSAGMNLQEITSLMVSSAKAGKKVVRLHSGDPSLYGAIREQTVVLDQADIAYAMVPGVSSAFASAAALKAELTMPEASQTVIFTRLAGRTPVPEKESLAGLAAHNATICVFLSSAMISSVVRELKKGYPASTPAAIVYRASWPDEFIITGTLKDIAKKARVAGIKSQAMIIVGRALSKARLGDKKSKLYDTDFRHAFRN